MLCILFLLDSLSLLALWTNVGIVTIQLAVEAHDPLVLRVIFFVSSQELIKFIRITWLFLAVSRFVANDPACMASDPLLWLIVNCGCNALIRRNRLPLTTFALSYVML